LLSLLQVTRPSGRDALSWSAEYKQKLERSPEYFRELVQATRFSGNSPVLLVVDQCEELFTLCSRQRTRSSFVEALLSILRPGDHDRVILTIREDFLDLAKQLPGLGNPKAFFRPPPFTTRELRRVIEEPAQRIGLKIHESVVNDLVNEVVGDPTALPLLQFALKQLWEHRERNRITWGIYQKVGRPSEALKRTADDVYKGLKTSENQKTAERIFMALVQPGAGEEFLRRRVFRETLERMEAADRVGRVLKRFVDSGLIVKTPGLDRGEDRFEVAHETLIRNWPRLAEWLRIRKALSQKLVQLNAAAKLWQQSGRKKGYLLSGSALDEAKIFRNETPELDGLIEASENAEKKSNLLWRLAAIGAVIGAIGCAIFFWNLDRIAEKQREIAIKSVKGVIGQLKDQLENGAIPIQSAKKLLNISMDTERDIFSQESTPESTAQRIRLLLSFSDVHDVIGEGENALSVAKTAKELAEKLSKSNVANNDWRRLIYLSSFRIGDQLEKQGKLEEAKNEYLGALALAEELFRANSDIQYLRDTAFVKPKIGDVVSRLNQLKEALDEFQSSLKTYQYLIDREPDNPDNKRDFATTELRIGDTLVAMNNRAKADEVYKAAVETLRTLVQQERKESYRSNLSSALNKLATFYKNDGKMEEALTMLNAALEIRKKLVTDHPSFALYKSALARQYWRVANLLTEMAEKTDAAKDKERTKSLWKEALAEYKNGLLVSRDYFTSFPPNEDLKKQQEEVQKKVESFASEAR
jgi:tetratricopeptide (TPR) repeat protein